MNRIWIVAIVAVLFLGGVGAVLLLDRSAENPELAVSVETQTTNETPPLGEAALSASEIATLSSVEKIDAYPMYVMHYVGDYRDETLVRQPSFHRGIASLPDWIGGNPFACSLFAAGEVNEPLLARNFDWHYHPFLLLFTDPSDGYASMSLVDLTYFVSDDIIDRLDEVALEDRVGLLATPHVPFDGMNEQGLAIGMAALSPSELPHDPKKDTRSSIDVIRDVLDYAATVEEAIELLTRVNIFMDGPPIHYMVADAAGDSAIVELGGGETHIFRPERPWQTMTNFRLHEIPEPDRTEACWRFATIEDGLSSSEGRLAPMSAMDLLASVRQASETQQMGTLWSAVYELRDRTVQIAVNVNYNQIYTFSLP